MHLKHLAVAAVLGLSSAVAAAATADFGSYTVTYDDTTPVFSGIDGAFGSSDNTVGFNWDVSTALSAYHDGIGNSQATFEIPSFTISSNPSHILSGPVTSFFGNISFTELRFGTVSVAVQADVSIDGSPTVTLAGALTRTETSAVPDIFTLGYFSGEASTPSLPFSTISVSNASLTVFFTGEFENSFASIQGQPQNQLRVSFVATPVPEPESYALMLAGLGLLGLLARRRRI